MTVSMWQHRNERLATRSPCTHLRFLSLTMLLGTCLIAVACRSRPEPRFSVAPVASALRLRSGASNQFLAIPDRAPSKWLEFAAYKPGVGRRRWRADAGSTPGVIVFVAFADEGGQISVEQRYADPTHPDAYRVTNRVIPEPNAPTVSTSPQRCAKDPWIAAFFIDGIGAKPQSNTAVYLYEGDKVAEQIVVNPARNTVRLTPTFEFVTAQLDAFVPRDLSFVSTSVLRSSGIAPAIDLLLHQSADGWRGGGRSMASNDLHMFSIHEGARRDLWQLFQLEDPNACMHLSNSQ